MIRNATVLVGGTLILLASCQRTPKPVTEFVFQVRSAEAVQPTIEAFKQRLNYLEVKGSVIERSGDRQIRVLLPPVDDLTPLKLALLRRAEFRASEVKAGPFPSREEALREYGGTLPPDSMVVLKTQVGDGPSGTEVLVVSSQSLFRNEDIENPSFSSNGADSSLTFRLKPETAQRMGAYSQSHFGQAIAMLIDDVALSAPVIRGSTFESININGLKEQEAKAWVVVLNLAPLPEIPEFLEERVIPQ